MHIYVYTHISLYICVDIDIDRENTYACVYMDRETQTLSKHP